MLGFLLLLITLPFVAGDSGVEGVFMIPSNVSIAFMFAPSEGSLSISISSLGGLFDVTVLPESQYYLLMDDEPYYDYPDISDAFVQSYSWTGDFVGNETYNWIVIQSDETYPVDVLVFIDWIDDCVYSDVTTGPRPPRTVPEYITRAVYPTQDATKPAVVIYPTQPALPDCSGHVAISLSAIGLWFLSILIAATYYFILKRKEAQRSSDSLRRTEMAPSPYSASS